MRYFIILLWALLLPAGAESSTLIGAKAPEFSLLDQRDKMVTPDQFIGKPVVLVASDKEGMKQNPAWRKALAERYGGSIIAQGVADVRKVPFFLKGSYKRDFQKDPDSIILDWEGAIFTAYGFAENVANIVLIDREGIVRYVYSGSADKDAIERLFREIERALGK